MSNSSPSSLQQQQLHRTISSLDDIKKSLAPFTQLLNSSSSSSSTTSDDPYDIAEAEAVTALTMGTLRYMNARLNGEDKGRKKDDVLRMELDKMRMILVKLRKLKNKTKERTTTTTTIKNETTDETNARSETNVGDEIMKRKVRDDDDDDVTKKSSSQDDDEGPKKKKSPRKTVKRTS